MSSKEYVRPQPGWESERVVAVAREVVFLHGGAAAVVGQEPKRIAASGGARPCAPSSPDLQHDCKATPQLHNYCVNFLLLHPARPSRVASHAASAWT